MTALKAGQLLELDRAASPQFAARTVRLRVVRELTDRPTYHGWLWLAGYELDARGDAIRLRELYVRRDGIRQAGDWTDTRQPNGPTRRQPNATH